MRRRSLASAAILNIIGQKIFFESVSGTAGGQSERPVLVLMTSTETTTTSKYDLNYRISSNERVREVVVGRFSSYM